LVNQEAFSFPVVAVYLAQLFSPTSDLTPTVVEIQSMPQTQFSLPWREGARDREGPSWPPADDREERVC
jgi:hypothetical protein